MKLERKFLIMALIAIALAIPVTYALQHRANLLKIEKSQNNTLHLQLDSKQKELEQRKVQQQNLQKKNDALHKQLQTKRSSPVTVAQARKAPVVTYAHGNCAKYRGLVAQYNWNVSTAMAVMEAESGCREVTPDNSAANYDHVADHGLFQLHGINVTDPAQNIKIAYTLKYLGAGSSFRPWVAFTTGSYLKYL